MATLSQLARAYAQLGNSDLAFAELNNAGQFSSNSKLVELRGVLFAKLAGTDRASPRFAEYARSPSCERYNPVIRYGVSARCSLASRCLRCSRRAPRLSSGGSKMGHLTSRWPFR